MKAAKKPKSSPWSLNIRVWKAIAVIFIAAFCLMLASGLMRAHYFRSSFVRATPEQVESATRLVEQDMQARGDNASEYQVRVADMIRRSDRDGFSESLVQVSLRGNSTERMYLIDVGDAGSAQIIVRSETDFYGGMRGPALGPMGKHGDERGPPGPPEASHLGMPPGPRKPPEPSAF